MAKGGLAQQAYIQIKEMITTGRLVPGTLINEAELQQEQNMGRTPVREALLRLELERLVVIHPRKGIEVARVSPKMIRDIFEMRLIVEPAILRKGIDSIEDNALEEVRRRILRAMQGDLSQKEASRESVETDYLLHKLITSSIHNHYAQTFNDSFSDHLRMIWVATTQHPWAQRPQDSNREHVMLIDTILRKEADQACQLLTEHLEASLRDTMEKYVQSGI